MIHFLRRFLGLDTPGFDIDRMTEEQREYATQQLLEGLKFLHPSGIATVEIEGLPYSERKLAEVMKDWQDSYILV